MLQGIEHRLDGPAQCVCFNDLAGGYRCIGGQQEAGWLWNAVLFEAYPNGADRQSAEKLGQNDGGAVADGLALSVDEQKGAGFRQGGGNCGLRHLGAEFWRASGFAGGLGRQVERQIAANLPDDGEALGHGVVNDGSPHVPCVEKQPGFAEEAPDGAQQHPCRGKFAVVAAFTDHPRQDGDGPTGGDGTASDDRSQRHPSLAPDVAGTVGLLAMIEVGANAGGFLGNPQHQGVVDDQIPQRSREIGDENATQGTCDGDPRPPTPFQPLVIGLPSSAWHDGEEGFGNEASVGDHRADQQFEEGDDGAGRNRAGQGGEPPAHRDRHRRSSRTGHLRCTLRKLTFLQLRVLAEQGRAREAGALSRI